MGRTGRAMVVAVLLVVALAGCSGSSADEADDAGSTTSVAPDDATTTTEGASTEPIGLVAIGHSGLTGNDSDPAKPGLDARENSWATGTAPEVDSIYRRLVAARPEQAGHVDNDAVSGAESVTLKLQATRALKRLPHPLLVIIQTIDNDIRCDGTDAANVATFGANLADALATISAASPATKILIVSQLGRPASFAASVAGSPEARADVSGDGICDLFDDAGRTIGPNIATLTSIIESYEAEQFRVCAAVPHCSGDDGKMATYVDRLSSLAPDHEHLSVEGLHQVAELMWPTVRTVLGIS